MPLDSVETPGILAEGSLLHSMRTEVASLLNRKSLSFAGAQPVSFSRKHLEELEKQDYYVCEKSDGMRYLLYLTGDGLHEIHYLINRKNQFWFIPPNSLHCPLPRDEQSWHNDTIIDGELVMDRLPSGETEAKYLVFDCLVLDGNSLMTRTLDKRLAYFNERVFEPYRQLLKKYPQEVPHQHFKIEMKAMQFAYAIEMMFRQVLPSLKHGNDGLIFTCRTSEYKFGTDNNILKWKPENENSIDFRLRLEFPLIQPDEVDRSEGITEPYNDYEAIPICNLHAYGGDDHEDPWFATMRIEPTEWESLKSLQEPLNDRIVECYMDTQKQWRFMRFRDDKTQANHITTVHSVIESIRDGVTKEDLMAAAPKIKMKWKQRAELTASGQTKPAQHKNSTSGTVDGPSPGAKRKAEDQIADLVSPGPKKRVN
ncbi:mRNA-capping enzyme subunit alpha [Podosphaera aphanis]|nr:mRNA-capping enzyme subunit alpha [Podosphaera aphanis]